MSVSYAPERAPPYPGQALRHSLPKKGKAEVQSLSRVVMRISERGILMADDEKKVEEVKSKPPEKHHEVQKSAEAQPKAPAAEKAEDKKTPPPDKGREPVDTYQRKDRPHEEQAPREGDREYSRNLESFRNNFMSAWAPSGHAADPAAGQKGTPPVGGPKDEPAPKGSPEAGQSQDNAIEKKTDQKADELNKQGVEVNRENLKNEVAFQDKLEKRNETFQKEAGGDVKALNSLEEKLKSDKLPADERAKLEKEYGQKKESLDSLRKGYETDIQKERLDVKVETSGSSPTNGQKQANSSLENVLLNQGYTRDEIYKNDGSLLNKVARENNLSDPNQLNDGMTLKIPPAQAKLNAMTEAKEKEGIVTKKADGSEVRELMDGTTFTKKPDGTNVKEYQKDGATITETSQQKDGAKINQVVTKQEDGSSKIVTTTEKNGIVEKTVADTKVSDKNIEDLISKEDRENLEKTADLEHNISGQTDQRGKTEITTTTKTITDTTTQPPVEKTVLESTNYSQTNKTGEQLDPPGGMTEVDEANSGKTFSVTETKVFDKDGKAQTIKDIGTEQVIKGKGSNGQDVTITRDDAMVSKDGKLQKELECTEYKGFDRDTMGDLSGVDGKGEFMERLQGESLNYRDMKIKTYEEGKDPKEVHEQSLGDYEHPDQDGRTVKRIEQDGKKYWNYTKVEDNGRHTQSQTVIEGTDAKILTDIKKNDDGTFKSDTKAYNGDELLEQTTTERRRVNASEIGGDQKYREEFLKANQDKQLYEERSYHLKWDTNEDGERTELKTTDARSYSSKDGTDKFTTVSASSKDGTDKTSILQDKNSDTPAKVKNEGDGAEYTINKKGEVTINGKRIDFSTLTTMPDDPNAPVNPDENTAKTGTDALKNLYDSVKKYEDTLSRSGRNVADLPASLKGTLGGLGVAMGSINLYNALQDGKPAEAISSAGDIASGLSALAPMAESALTSTALKSAVGVGGRVLGGVGAAIGIGYGAYEMSQGKTLQGALDIGAGVGVGAALVGVAIGSSVVPVVGWAVAGACIVAKIGLDVWNYFDSKDDTAKLEI